MGTNTQKTLDQPNKVPVAKTSSKKQGNNNAAFEFTDNRLEAITQRKIQKIMNQSPQVSHLSTIQKIADNYVNTKQGTNLENGVGRTQHVTQQKKERAGTKQFSAMPIQLGKWVKGRLVEDDELDKGELGDIFYSTWGYVEKLTDKNADPTQYTYQKQNLSPAWLIAWQAFEAEWDTLHHAWVASNRGDFSPYAKGQAIWGLKNTLDGIGGSLKKGEDGRAKLPHVIHQEEGHLDAFIARGNTSYLIWSAMVLPTLATRGPFDGNRLTGTEVLILTSGKRPTPGWTVHPSDTGGFALHRPGPGHAQIDPKTGKPATFIYHVL